MAVVTYSGTVRAGLLPGTLQPASTFLRSWNGRRNDPYVKARDWKPLDYSSIVKRSSILQAADRYALYGPSSHDCNVVWTGQTIWGGSDASGITAGAGTPSDNALNIARNKARAKLLDKLSSESMAAWMTSLGEARSTFDMVNRRVQALNRAAGYMEDGTIRGANRAAKALRIPKKRRPPSWKVKSYLRIGDLGGLWLEYWMGWAPLFGDVWNGLRAVSEFRSIDSPIIVSGVSGIDAPFHRSARLGYSTGTVKFRCGVRAALVSYNPNKRLARDLGLTNPFVTIHDLIPWSWFAGWFQNLSEVLGQFDDMYGISLDPDSICSWELGKIKGVRALRRRSNGPYDVGSYEEIRSTRKKLTSLPGVKLVWNFKGFHLTRGFTLASLLGQKLKKFGVAHAIANKMQLP